MFEWLSERLHVADELTNTWDGVNLIAEFRPPATADALARCESDLNCRLPESFRAFLGLHDGGFVGAEIALPRTTSTTGFQIYSSAECADATRGLPEELAPFELPLGALDGLIVFASYGNSDICLFDSGRPDGLEYPVIDGFHEVPGEWREAVIAPTFEDWLRNIFEALTVRRQYPQYWIETPLHRL